MMNERWKKLLIPFWKSETVHEETILLVEKKEGGFEGKKLMYPIEEVLQVTTFSRDRTFVSSKDYYVENGELFFLENTAAPFIPYDEFYLNEPGKLKVSSIKEKGKFLRIADGRFFNQYYLLVTYKTKRENLLPSPEKYADKCKAVIEKLKAREFLNFVFYGDSITTGVNASGYFGCEPRTPVFSQMIVKTLREYYGYVGQSDIAHINTAVGGWTSINGMENLKERVLDKQPDILFLGFGMNDGGGRPSECFGEQFYERMTYIVRAVKEQRKDCFIILASPMLPNSDAFNVDDAYPVLSNQPQCTKMLEKIANENENVVLVDVTKYFSRIAERKNFSDMGDNMVHPNDFIARLYAQMVLNLFIDERSVL